jgi:hypothetical protein
LKFLITLLTSFAFLFTNLTLGNAQQLPAPGTKLETSVTFSPILVKGLIVNPNQPLNFDFIVDSGNDSINPSVIKEQSERIIKYFLAALTVPTDSLWVNLSPYEKNRIIDQNLGQTLLGQEMLAQDYILKQFTASLIYPEDKLGHEFWSRIYKEAQQKFGTTNIPINTFNKVWIIPQQAMVYEKNNAVYVTQARLKVMLDSDYLAMQRNKDDDKTSFTKNIIRQLLLPAIEREVNTGKNFATLRQFYYAAILAKWYRHLIEDTLMSKVYVGKNKLLGIKSSDTARKEKIYLRYMSAYKKGVFNYIKEDHDPISGNLVLHKYFSGGLTDFAMLNLALTPTTDEPTATGELFKIKCTMAAISPSPAKSNDLQIAPASTKQIDEIIKVHHKAWAHEPSLQLGKDVLLKLINKGNVYVLQNKNDHVIKGVLLVHWLNSKGKIKKIKDLALWPRMTAGSRPNKTYDTVLFWAISVPENGGGIGQEFIRLAKAHFKGLSLTSTFSPIQNKDFENFKKELQQRGLDERTIKKHGIYLYLASTKEDGPWPYIDYIKHHDFITPEEFFKSRDLKFRDLTERFHVGKNGARIGTVIPRSEGSIRPRPDSAYGVFYRYDDGGKDGYDYAGFRELRNLPDFAQTNVTNGGIDIRHISWGSDHRIYFIFDDTTLQEMSSPDFKGLRPHITSVTTIKTPLQSMD